MGESVGDTEGRGLRVLFDVGVGERVSVAVSVNSGERVEFR